MFKGLKNKCFHDNKNKTSEITFKYKACINKL